MRIPVIITTLITASFILSTQALASDEFGAMFTNQAPAAFGDVQSVIFAEEESGAIAPHLIEPAAGDEDETPTNEVIENDQTILKMKKPGSFADPVAKNDM